MNILPLLFLYMINSSGDRKHARRRAPHWPHGSHPPPKKAPSLPAMPPMPPMPHDDTGATAHHEVHHAAHNTTPADHAYESHEGHPTTTFHEPHLETPHDMAERAPDVLKNLTSMFGGSPARHAAPAARPVVHRARKVRRADPSIVPVSDVQSVLRSLGWKGHLTTRGPLSSDLTDGLAPLHWPDQPSTTADDWVQSARKRGLDGSFARVDSHHVRVNPVTLAKLRSVGGGVSGIYIP